MLALPLAKDLGQVWYTVMIITWE